MSTFPTLSINPERDSYKEKPGIDPTIRSEMDSGIIITRQKFTRVPLAFEFEYSMLPADEKIILQSFEVSCGYGSGSFTWTNPTNSIDYTVRFSDPIEYKLSENGVDWDVIIKILEV